MEGKPYRLLLPPSLASDSTRSISDENIELVIREADEPRWNGGSRPG